MARPISGLDNRFGRCSTCGQIRLWREKPALRGLGFFPAKPSNARPIVNPLEQEYDKGARCTCSNPTGLGSGFPGVAGTQRSRMPRSQSDPRATPSQAAGQPVWQGDLTSEIERLADLLKSGVLTREQFDAAVNKLLKR